MFKIFYKKIIPVPKVEKYNRFLFISAHSGDAARTAGGTLSKLSGKGKEIKIIVTTDSLSTILKQDERAKDIEKRKKEEIASATLMGVKEVEFFSYEDKCDIDIVNLREELIKAIFDYKPDIVFIDDINTPNEIMSADKITAMAAMQAMEILQSEYRASEYGYKKQRVKGIAMYNTVHPNGYIGIIGATQTKLNAVMVHSSQLPEGNEERFAYMRAYKSLINTTAIKHGLKSFKLLAEGFYIIGLKSAHNMPEINF